MNTTFQTVEGTNDLLPRSRNPLARTEVWRHIEDVIHQIMFKYGFSEIRTPILEQTGLFARGIGTQTDIVSKEMFTLERGHASYVLRPELTAPIMRSYLQHHLGQQPGVQRLYYMGPCFRAERPQKGRYRQFHQFGAEIIGTDTPRADAEIIAVMMEIYRSIGINDTRLRINTLGSSEVRHDYRKALISYLTPHRMKLTQISQERLERNPLRILDTKVETERQILKNAPCLSDYIDHESSVNYELLKQLLRAVMISFEEDPMLVRGLDYYNRTAFELEYDGIGAQNALAGGGRYDFLAPTIGAKGPIPAVGFAAGMERLILALNTAKIEVPSGAPFDAWFIALGEEAGEQAFIFAQSLRREGIRAGLDLQGRSMKAQMRLANRMEASQVIILAEQEMKTEIATVKNMLIGTQESIPFPKLTEYLTGKRTNHVPTPT